MATCSSFHGVIDEIPGISVDNFENPYRVRARAYFLSHCHTDHTKGLHTPELLRTLEQTGAFIYMSANTEAVIRNEGIDYELMEYVKVLRLGSNPVTLPAVPEKDLDSLHLDVVLVPAGHCFGSVMFIFKMAHKNVIFTGDFRISHNDISTYTHFHENGKPLKLSAMYVDTTFINEKYTVFPKRTTSVEEALDEIQYWLNKDDSNRVALHTSAKYGYEFVFNKVLENLKMKVYVDDNRWSFYSTLPDLIPGVTNDEKTKIHLCRNWSENRSHERCIPNSVNTKFLYVHFSAMKWDNFDSESSFRRVSESRLDVCFPTHCSRSELLHFIKYFGPPKKVIGFPNKYDEENTNTTKINTNQTVVEKENFTHEVRAKKKRLNSHKNEKKVCEKVDRKLMVEMFELL